ncbi:MAG: cell division protein FtsQ/DivIB [Alphaproteobacteria bacterium]|nr:cell division protein FtsQ/DivIB [Alphaproteobacteria bacterium]
MSASMRRGVMWTVPIVLVAGGYALFTLSHVPAGQAILAQAIGSFYQASASLGLVVNDIEVSGRETTDVPTILAALAADRGTPILAVSPSRAKQQLEALPWVRSAAIERRLPGTLYVRLVERHPLAVWQHAGKQELIDSDGEVIPIKDFSHFAHLPTVVGESAAHHAADLLATLAQHPELASRVTAAVEVDGRRWNVRIDNAIDVMLPEEDPSAAWSRLAAMERENSVLKHDVQSVDLRLPDRVVLRSAAVPPQQKEAGPAKPRAAGKNT